MISQQWKRNVLVAIVIAAILCVITAFYIKDVRSRLWQESINTITESTKQGSNALGLLLSKDFDSLDTMENYIKTLPSSNTKKLGAVLSMNLKNGTSLYLENGTCLPDAKGADAVVAEELKNAEASQGVLDPHISTVTGVNVLNLYKKIIFADGRKGFLVKEYEVEEIAGEYSLSFYNNAGFSYIISKNGRILIRSPHPNSSKTIKNLFDLLPENENDPDSIGRLRNALQKSEHGWALFQYKEESTVFCYTPLKHSTDWYVVSIIPKEVISEQSNDILLRTMLLVLAVILGILALVLFYLWRGQKTTQMIKRQAEYISHLYDSIPEGIAVMAIEPPYPFIEINRKGLRMLGYPSNAGEDAVLGTQLAEVIHPEDMESTERIFREAVDSSAKQSFLNRIKLSNGTTFWASGIVEKTIDKNGTSVLVATFHDVTSEKMAEDEHEKEKLLERRTLLSAISSAYPIIISINLTRDEIDILYFDLNLEIDLGMPSTYTDLYETFLPLLEAEAREECQKRFSLEALQETLGPEKNEVFLQARGMLTDGEYHWISTQIIYVENPYSDDKMAILLSRRVDEQKNEEEQNRRMLQSALDNANAANEAKSRFLSNMSHDIRTPMNAIVGMTAIAMNHLGDKEKIKDCLRKIDLSGAHLLNLINDVLDMSKIESGKLVLREEPFNLAELIMETVALVRVQAQAKGLDINISLEPLKSERVIGDPLRLRQVFLNIISNAVKYTPDNGQIEIEVSQLASMRRGYGTYQIRCADTGLGMSEEFLNKLFTPFERLQNSTTSKITGTGLGMAITKNIIDLMNGHIEVKSQLGEGSVFTVTLSLKQEDERQERVPEEWLGMRTLIIDNDLRACEAAVEVLQDMGLHAEFISDGRAAIDKIEALQGSEDTFGLILVDWKMPGMDGAETAARIRKIVGEEVPIIILTAYDWSEIAQDAKQNSISGFLSKPLYRSNFCYLLNELQDREGKEPLLESFDLESYKDKRVLLVEDNLLNMEIARELLKMTGVGIEEAHNGKDAVRMFEHAPAGYYGLIFMDIQMPVMDGYEATKQIRALNRQDGKSVPIIAMTANAFEEDVQAAALAGMNGHISKPIDTKLLLETLKKWLL